MNFEPRHYPDLVSLLGEGASSTLFLLYNGVECSNNGGLNTQSCLLVLGNQSQAIHTQSTRQSTNIKEGIFSLFDLKVQLSRFRVKEKGKVKLGVMCDYQTTDGSALLL